MGAKVTETSSRRDITFITAELPLGQLKLDITPGLDATSVKTLMEDGAMNLEALFANALSPYPGDLSHRVVTEERFKPVRWNTAGGPAFLLYADDRLGFGVSTREQVRHRALLAWRYVRATRCLIKIRLYAPSSTPDSELRKWLQGLR